MVTLKNVKRDENSVSADYYPEGEEPKGFMRLDATTREVIEHERSGIMAPTHVRNLLNRMLDLDKYPEEATVFWY